ncbi:outer membrane receptor protein involved in Fe transport [Mesoflavibacter sabulilitoris]|uniref:TonB-dependent receptor n=1 Tax=Mesoflavibacter zeaxanthinifaciens subsp. sabulilitoris TaxID=1520893 RepID=A0A2T1NH19_9FLAO|nr:TonB-dependent receptor [Mesoflavibacter zeaxanthinifaciens]MBB3122848.1 outer membrane receptor protein involved in Fe transport [Mesoflavibacter zeaxanthinifaciens subsp. sabulilitoris]PSG92072.1 TonB-dependent receptor [Mesoflavibacter zeaxanthinifaciens subsp. sabulilitoris]
MTKKILTSFILLFTTLIFAQNEKEITVKGKIVDASTQTPLEYATIVFTSTTDASDVTGGITDTKGNYNIKVAAGTYNISYEYIGFKKLTINNKSITSNTNLGTTSLSVDAETLDEIEIVAEKTTVDIRLDKKIYNIGKDLTTAGGTVSDALNNVPSVSVDIEGGISLRGNENVRILINGKPSALAGFGDSNVLSQLPAEAIERVEVITSPSARYDAEGTAGILNIILRQKETLGFNGSINLNAGNPDLVGVATTLNYRTEKFNLFSNIGFRYFDAPRTSDSDTYYFDYLDEDGILQTPEYRQIIEDQDVTRLNRNYNGNIGMEYFLSDKTSLTGSFFYRYGEDADLSTNISERYNGGLVEQTTRYERQNEEDNSYQFALNYITKFDDNGHQLTADFQYVIDKEEQFTFLDENYDFTEDANPEPFQREQIYQTEDQKEYLVQADYVLPIGEDSRFEAGYRGSFQNEVTDYLLEQENITDGSLFVNDTITNVFDYSENVNALYTQYGTKLGKFSFLLGLRLEHTQLKGKIDSRLSDQELNDAFSFPIDTDFDKNYLGLFPTVNLIYNLAKEDQKEESITLGYNRRINRPRGWFINPFPTRSSRTRVFQGNPNLDPAFSSTFDLGYLKRWDKLTLTTSVYYQHETDSFERVQENTGSVTTDGINIIRTIPVNLSTNKRTGAELGVLFNPEKWLRLNSSINFFQFNTEGEFNGVDYSAKNTSWFARFSSKVTLPAKIDWQTNAFYRGARSDAQSDTDGIFSMDLAFSKEIFKDKATLSLNVRDVFNSRKRNSVTTTATERVTSEFQWRQRQITLSMIYRFNQKKDRNRGSRNNNYNGDDEFEG